MNERPAWVLPDELRQLAEHGESGLVQEVLAVFQSDTAERLRKVLIAIANNDRSEVRHQSHAIRGSAGQVGAHAVAALCHSLESLAPTAGPAELQDLARRAETAFAEVVRDMNA
jgi:histidine phosphotransfer protein HptB